MDHPALVMPAHQTGATRRMKNRVGIGVRQPPILPHHELLSSQVSQRRRDLGHAASFELLIRLRRLPDCSNRRRHPGGCRAMPRRVARRNLPGENGLARRRTGSPDHRVTAVCCCDSSAMWLRPRCIRRPPACVDCRPVRRSALRGCSTSILPSPTRVPLT